MVTRKKTSEVPTASNRRHSRRTEARKSAAHDSCWVCGAAVRAPKPEPKPKTRTVWIVVKREAIADAWNNYALWAFDSETGARLGSYSSEDVVLRATVEVTE